jgi:hypothetical protein
MDNALSHGSISQEIMDDTTLSITPIGRLRIFLKKICIKLMALSGS